MKIDDLDGADKEVRRSVHLVAHSVTTNKTNTSTYITPKQPINATENTSATYRLPTPSFNVNSTSLIIGSAHDRPVVPLRDAATKRLAQQCVKAGGQGGIYIKHFRKAGGTSLYRGIREQSCLKQNISAYGSEFPFFDPRTFDVLNSTIFITSMRHPVDRIISMYWFEGRWPRVCAKSCEEKRIKNDTTKVADLDEWIEHVHDQTEYHRLQYTRHDGCGQWISVENYYIRMLLGLDRTSNRKEQSQTMYNRGFQNVTITREHLHRAKEILASFDAVLIQDQMEGASDSIQMYHELIGHPRESAPNELKHSRMGSERARYYQPPNNRTLQQLYEWNALDIELYEYAVHLSSKLVEDWRKREGGNSSELDFKGNCIKPPHVLPDHIFDIALGGNFCRKRRWYYFSKSKCLLHSTEARLK